MTLLKPPPGMTRGEFLAERMRAAEAAKAERAATRRQARGLVAYVRDMLPAMRRADRHTAYWTARTTGSNQTAAARVAGVSPRTARKWERVAGGGILGKSAAEQPADFYVDARVSRRPYPLRQLYRAVKTLALLAEANGLNPHAMPAMPDFHNLGVF